jgi:CSLREA domain-containing protein
MPAMIMAMLAWTGYAATFDVNSTDDAVDCNPGNGVAETAPGNGVCTLRAAIMEANALAGADAVNLPAGTYALTIAGTDEDASATGDLDITDDLTITGAGADVTRVGSQLDRVFHIVGASTACTLTGFTTGFTLQWYDASGDGGGLYNEGTVTLAYCSIENNGCTGNGGGLYNASGTVTLSNSALYENEADVDGGGLYSAGGTVAVSNCTFYGNLVAGYGQGVCIAGGTATLLNSTIHRNYSAGGGICQLGGTVAMGNSVVATTLSHLVTSVDNASVIGAFTSLGHNFIGRGDGATGFTDGVNGDHVGTIAAPLDARLRDPNLYMGTTRSCALRQDSPLLDAGDNALLAHAAFAGSPDYDQRGAGHPRTFDADRDGTATVDIGAFEATPSVFTVNTTADAVDYNPGDGIAETEPGNGICTLRAAIMEANALAGAADIIIVPAGTYRLTIEGIDEDACATGDLDVLDDLIVTGVGEDDTIIDGNEIDRVLHVFNAVDYQSVGSRVWLSLSDLTITRGYDDSRVGGVYAALSRTMMTNCAVSGNYGDIVGGVSCQLITGGGANYHNSFTNCAFVGNTSGGTAALALGLDPAVVTGCRFVGNTALDAFSSGAVSMGWSDNSLAYRDHYSFTNCSFVGNITGADGGGTKGQGTFTNCIYKGNRARRGGGAALGGIFTNCAFIGNEAESRGGGAWAGDLFTNCTFSGNSTGWQGGGIFLQVQLMASQDSASVTNCTITGNSAMHGGGLYVESGECRVGNTIVARNTEGADLGVDDEYGSFTSLGHNIIGWGGSFPAFVNGVNGDHVGVDPLLESLADNGGDTWTHALLGGSPALDAGDNALVANPPFDGPPFYDQRGEAYDRMADADGDGTATVDIGAFEAQPLDAYGDAYEVEEGGTLDVSAPGVLGNDIADVGASLTAAVVTGPAHGGLTLNADGSFTYVHDGSETTLDTFAYAASNGVATAQGIVTVTIYPVNDPPVAVNDAYNVVEGATLTVSAASGVLANDADAEGNPFIAVLVTGPAHANLTLNANGSFVYAHGGGEAASDSFTYCANDGSGNGPVATVTITVTPVNDEPVANGDAYTVQRGETFVVPAPGVLANDTDAEGGPLTAVLVNGTSHGALTLNANGSFTYGHDGTDALNDSFTYRVSDGTANSNSVPVVLTIDIANDTPSDILLSNATVPEGRPAGTLVGSMTAVDPDINETHVFTLVAGAGGDDNASFLLEAMPGGTGAYLRTSAVFLFEAKSSRNIRVRVNDGNGGVFEKALTITVLNVSSDLDGDGVSDADEAAAGTDPFDTAHPTATMSVMPASIDAPLLGGVFNVAVTNTGRGTLTWEASVTSGGDWLAIVGGGTGSLGGIVSVSCTKNQSGTSRTGVVRVTSSNAVGSPTDVVVRQGVYGLPEAPTNVQATDGTETASVVVTWNAVAGATYAVYRSDTADFAAASLLGPASGPCYVDTTAARPTASNGCGGTQEFVYRYWVVSVNSSGVSAPCGPDTGYCGLAKSGVYEDVLPSKAAGDGMQAAQLDSPLAIRLRSDEPIDCETVWGTVAWAAFATESVTWQPVSDTDGWVVFEPEDLWQFGETAVMTVGAMTVSGEAVGPVTYTFQVESEDMLAARWDKNLDAVWQPGADDYAAMGMAPSSQSAAVALADDGAVPVLNGAGPACVIGPDRLFDAPQWVWLPVPDGVSASELGVFYFKAGGEGAGWHPADSVEGWLAPEGCVQCECNGVEYLGIQALHGGVVQLAPADPAPAHPAGMLQGDILVFGLLVGVLVLARGKAVGKQEVGTGGRVSLRLGSRRDVG